MRRHIKNEVLGVLETLKNASSKVKTVLKSENYELLQNYLTECQNAAIQVGNTIELAGEEGEKAVSFLEEFCELLYKTLLENRDYSKELLYFIKKAITEIDCLPEKKEVVFLPYKASMWDSLESVWMAARDDDNCDAYVVPIPYYDKNQDGSLGELHYEGNQYPDYVPITSWQEYDLKSRRPDVVYIHNPYDGWNYVTSVHPSFYAKELKKYTDELVYIPYFVLPEISPNDQFSVDSMKHFCFLPGTIYADKVIVQSEDVKQIYVNEYIKAAAENGLSVNREELNKKFLGSGSPKFDKVKNTKKEDLKIPDKWLQIIKKSDGSWKKIIFYNISISTALKYGQQWMDKIKDALQVFKENQDEVALLWRPHPLIENTLRSMKPELLEEYQNIRDNYIEEGWGIYDDTADLDRAVVLSDAYYGDQSSVVEMCLARGKPVMIQSSFILYMNIQ